MMNAEFRNAKLGFAPIQHSAFLIPHSIQEIRRSKTAEIPIQTQVGFGFI